MIRMVLLADADLTPRVLSALAESGRDLEALAAVRDELDALCAVRNLSPTHVLLQMSLIKPSMRESCLRLVRRALPTHLLVLLEPGQVRDVPRLVAEGVGCVRSDELVAELPHLLAHPSVKEPYVSEALQPLREREWSLLPEQQLTSRQREVLTLIADGRTLKEVASSLSLSVKTVESHRGQLMQRLGARSTADLVRYAIRAGLVSVRA